MTKKIQRLTSNDWRVICVGTERVDVEMVYCEVVEWWEWVGCVDVEEGSLYWLEIDLC